MARKGRKTKVGQETTDHQLVSIEWLDSKGVTTQWEWRDEIDPLEPSRCVSVGFIIEQHDEYTTIVQTLGGEQILGRLTIPTGAIQRVTYLTRSRQQTRPILPRFSS